MQKFISRKVFRNYANKENDYLCTFELLKEYDDNKVKCSININLKSSNKISHIF